jgi:hypothetical protein
LDEEIGVKTSEKFAGAPEIWRLMGVAQERQRMCAEAEERMRYPRDAASDANSGRSRVAGEKLVTAGAAKSDRDVLAGFM